MKILIAEDDPISKRVSSQKEMKGENNRNPEGIYGL